MEINLGGLTLNKRTLISKDNARMMFAVTAAAVVFVVGVVLARALWSQMQYQNRVIAAKTTARDNLQANVKALQSLASKYSDFDKGTIVNSKVVLNALPSKYDFPALAASVEKLVNTQTGSSRYKLESFGGSDLAATAEGQSGDPKPVAMPFSIEISGNYEALKQFVLDLERSIRPFKVTSMQISGADETLRASMQVETYYQPVKTFEVTSRTVQ